MHGYKETPETGQFIRGLIGSWFCRLYRKHNTGICFFGYFKKLPMMVEGEGGAGVSHGRSKSKKEKGGRCHTFFNDQISQELAITRTVPTGQY